MFFFSISTPALTNASAKSALLTDPNNLSPFPTLASKLTTKPSNLADLAVASAINAASSALRASKTSFNAVTFLE